MAAKKSETTLKKIPPGIKATIYMRKNENNTNPNLISRLYAELQIKHLLGADADFIASKYGNAPPT
jgi:hypothetical protein